MSGKSNAFSSSVSSAFVYGQPSLKMESSSELELEEFVFQWKLNVPEGLMTSATLTSPIFIGGVRSQHSWQLKSTPDFGIWTVQVKLIKIGNKECSENGKEVHANAFIHFKKPQIQSDLEIQKELKDLKLFGLKPGTVAFSSSLATSELLLNRKNYIDNENETFTVYCRLIVKCGMKHSEIRKTLLPCLESAQNKVSVGFSSHHSAKTLKHLYNLRNFTDIIIETNTERIPAHKAVLAAQSPVFNAMFQTRMLESQRNVIEIKEFSTDVVKTMLEFIYTGEVSDLTDPRNVADLLRMSDKYRLLELKDISEEKMCSLLGFGNAAEFFYLATLHNAKTLEIFALRFIHENKLKVGETEFFKKLVETNPNLLLELYRST